MVKHVRVRDDVEQQASEQECTLGGVRVTLRARYSFTADRWYVSIYTTANVLLVGSLACVPGVDLLAPYKYKPEIPSGQLFCSSTDRLPMTFDTADSTARLLYR